jgi:hypothetical protein
MAAPTDFDDTTIADEAAPKRRREPHLAIPNESIPEEVNEGFLADLAFERALSAARSLSRALGRYILTAEPRGPLSTFPKASASTPNRKRTH